MKIPFSPPDITEQDIEAVGEALRSGWITTGQRTKTLETKLADYVSTPACICLSSQTACAEMALRLLGVGEGDEVVTTAYTYTATASVVCHVGAKLVLVDTQKDSFEMDYDALSHAITPATKVVIPVDLAGVPCDYDKIFGVLESKKHLFTPNNQLQEAFGRVIVLADTAHALGAVYHDQMVGSVADFSAFSFHAVKNLTTAEGGALTWRHIEGVEDSLLYGQLKLLSLHGQSRDALEKNALCNWEYDVLGTWYKCNMTDMSAALGLSQLSRYDGMLSRRRQIIERYDTSLAPLGLDLLEHFTNTYTSSGHLYLTRIPSVRREERDAIIAQMAQRGVACNVHYKPLPMLTAYKNMGFDIKDFPNAYARYQNQITLPLYSRMTDEEVDYVIQNYTDVVRTYIS